MAPLHGTQTGRLCGRLRPDRHDLHAGRQGTESDFSDLIVNSQTHKGIDPKDWLYTNSFFYEGAYQASLSGEIISIFASRTSPINYIGDFHDGVNDTGWIVSPRKNLPVGTNVTVTISQKTGQPKQ